MTESFVFGKLSAGEPVPAVRIVNRSGASAVILSYGAALQSLTVPNAHGGFTDVVLGYDSAEEYERNDSFLGATIGRFANRIGGASFSLGGKTYVLAKNDGLNHLHGGIRGFDKQLWTLEAAENSVVCTRISPDGEEGYPGTLNVRVCYTLDEKNTLTVSYDAVSDKDTLVNLTNHSYFNLSGKGDVLRHELRLNAERFLENDGGCLPTGTILSVENTAFDFQESKAIGRDLFAPEEQLKRGKGYDHNFILSGTHAARLLCSETGICMDVITDLPGVQLYTSNCLTSRRGKGGAEIGKFSGVCLETQLFPNAMNCWGFPSPVLRAGVSLHTETKYCFTKMGLN